MRGKGRRWSRRRRVGRFTPAHAGKGARVAGHPSDEAVHPRACGERRGRAVGDVAHSGSPPRMRGKARSDMVGWGHHRFTPAHAGKGPIPPCGRLVLSVHPRACGERYSDPSQDGYRLGSPPRMRGKGKIGRYRSARSRFTPAHAGKGEFTSPSATGSSVHPRACGERGVMRKAHPSATGSPPRMRGKASKIGFRLHPIRFTPAHAGKGAPGQGQHSGQAVHPRACGERYHPHYPWTDGNGSPPRMRGKVTRRFVFPSAIRFTPAHAGKGVWCWFTSIRSPVHPRACGERATARRSSCRRWRFTPAHAGKGVNLGLARVVLAVHPRACGERYGWKDMILKRKSSRGKSTDFLSVCVRSSQ